MQKNGLLGLLVYWYKRFTSQTRFTSQDAS